MSSWIDFLRKYGPIPTNDNMYDESIQRASKRLKIDPIIFEHPFKKRVFEGLQNDLSRNIILTGTAGDGKTHLCREIWNELGGAHDKWSSNDPLLTHIHHGRSFHFIRDLSAWAPTQGKDWNSVPEKQRVMLKFCSTLFRESESTFIIAGNDGQLIEALSKLSSTEDAIQAKDNIEGLLVNEKQSSPNLNLSLYNLSLGNSAELFELALSALLKHPGWEQCKNSEISGLWGEFCSIRKNYELLKTELVQQRLKMLFELCDHSSFHLPIRQVLLLLTNAILGHSQAKDFVLKTKEISSLATEKSLNDGCLFTNIFGGNLKERRRKVFLIFQYFERFQIGYETNNKIDNLLIFGEDDLELQEEYKNLTDGDPYYSHNKEYQRAKKSYIEAADEESTAEEFLTQLVRQRQALFFRIPFGKEEHFGLWKLTVFQYAGEYLDVYRSLASGKTIQPKIVNSLVKGLNRIFTGMFFNYEDELILAESGTYSQNRVSRIMKGSVSVRPKKGEKISLSVEDVSNKIILTVQFEKNSEYPPNRLPLNLIRYEFLSRVSRNGALPASFSKECYEDILTYKEKLIAEYERLSEGDDESGYIQLSLLFCKDGKPDERTISIRRGV